MGLTTQNEVTDALTSAMQTIAESNVQSKEATLTIEAEIVEIIDEGLGKYKVKYLGNKFDATTAHTEVTYQVGDMVYVIVPNGNFDKNDINFLIKRQMMDIDFSKSIHLPLLYVLDFFFLELYTLYHFFLYIHLFL